MAPTRLGSRQAKVAEQGALSSKARAQLLVDLERIRELVAECLVSSSDCKEALICQQIRKVSLPLCQLSLARAVELLNSNIECDGHLVASGSMPRLNAYAEVIDEVIGYIERIRGGDNSGGNLLENIEEKMAKVGVVPTFYAKSCLENCPAGVMAEFLEGVSRSLRELRSVLMQWREVPEHKPLATEFLRCLHALKGGVLVYGAAALVDILQRLESCVAAFLKGELKACEKLFEMMERYLSRLGVAADLLGNQQASQRLPALGSGGEQVLPLPQIDGLRGGDLAEPHEPPQPFTQKLPRLRYLVERASAMLGKPVRLVVKGEEVKLPAEIVGKLVAPLELLLWNAIDHGIESKEARAAAGKPPVGVITLALEVARQQVKVTVADDGAGVDEAAVRQKALSLGCAASLQEAQEMALSELLFYPGLSTFSVVSPMSGRGMGLDVVNTAVSRLGGDVAVENSPGQGASFTLTIPF